MEVVYWAVFLFALFVFEVIVPGPTALWFAVGAIVGGIISFLGGSAVLQWSAFVITSIIVAIALRPAMKKWKEMPLEKTNVDALIGKIVNVIETINNYEETGVAMLEGKEWTARSVDEDVILYEGTKGIVREISGVKLILEPVEFGG